MFDLSDPQRQWQQQAAEVGKILADRAAETDRSEQYPWYAVELLRESGLIGMTLPREYGGAGASYLDAVIVIEQIAAACAAAGRIVVETNMGAIGAIMRYGSENHKRLASQLVLDGDKPAICITEPNAGSSATMMTTAATLEGEYYRLNGEKHWITGGGVSRLHLIFAKTEDEGNHQNIQGFIVVRDEPGSEGLVIGEREPAMGIRGIPETQILIQDLLVPAHRRLDASFSQLMQAYNAQRIGAATVALGIARGAFELAVQYSGTRKQFGRPIGEFQGLQWMMADMSIQVDAAQALIYKAASRLQQGFPDRHLSAAAKVLASETAVKVTNDALQIFGSAGYSRRNPLERMVRDARMFTISGGTAQVLRNQIAESLLQRKLPQTRDGYLTNR